MDEQQQLLDIQLEIDQRKKYSFIYSVFPEKDCPDDYEMTGYIFSRSKYKKHISFLNAGAKFKQRAFIAANRVGKSFAGAYEMACHLIGWYPDWWEGKRFNRPVTAWLCGDRMEAVRDGVQKLLLERSTRYKGDIGTGLLPKESIISLKGAGGNIPGAYGLYEVRHSSGGLSTLTVKTYQSGRTAFESASVDVVMLDEECPREIYSECLLRTLTTGGTVYLTFTPDSGLTDTVLAFFEDGDFNKGSAIDKFVVMVGWDDVPHIAKEEQTALLSAMMPHEIECRTKGIPFLGAGTVYPFSDEDITCDPFKIPEHYNRWFAMDVGWNKTAGLWFASDPDSETIYAYSEYYAGQSEPSTHAFNVRTKGAWIPGVIDPASRGRSQRDGEQLYQLYLDLGLNISPAKNAVESGIYAVYQLFAAGKLKIFSTCQYLLRERRLYRRTERGDIVKKDDHLMDCLRYGIISGRDIGSPPPIDIDDYTNDITDRSPISGY